MNEYLYGAYGKLGATVAQNAVQSGTAVVYFGTAPINLIRGYKTLSLVNKPIKLSNWLSAIQSVGYSDDWDSFTLSEVISAHFANSRGNIGPVYVVNVLNPEIHVAGDPVEASLTFSNGQAVIKSSTIILDTLTITGLIEGTDYSVDYDFTKGQAVINSIGTKITGSKDATYSVVEPSRIADTDIIGDVTADGEYSGIKAVALLYQNENVVANILAAPKWSELASVYNALVSASQEINGHWDAVVYADIPLAYTNDDGDEVAVDTIEKAITWKNDNGYGSERSKVYWPQAKANTVLYHTSVLACVETLRTDNSHGSVPMETCGNKIIPVAGQYFGTKAKNQGFDQITANKLTQNGISTLVFWGGNWVLWGDHTAAYKYGKDMDARAIFDVSMRMLMYITNSFQREWGTEIDKPFTKQLRDRIINREQEKLDSLVAQGALIGHPTVEFVDTNNSTSDMMNGDFRWDIATTPTPPFKSATVYVAYTDAGFSAYFED